MSDLAFGTTDSHIIEKVVSNVLVPDFVDEILQEFDDSRIGAGSWMRPTEILALRLKNQPYKLRPLRVEGYDPLDPNPNQGGMFFAALEKKLAEQDRWLAPILVQKVWDKLPPEVKKRYKGNFGTKLTDGEGNPAEMYNWRVGYPSRPYESTPPMTDAESISKHNFRVSLPAELRDLTDYQLREELPPLDPNEDPTYIGDVSIADLDDPTKAPVGIAAPLFGVAPTQDRFGGNKLDTRPKKYAPAVSATANVKLDKSFAVSKLSAKRELELMRWWDTRRYGMPEPDRGAILPKSPKRKKAKARERLNSVTGTSAMAILLLHKKK